MVSVSTRVLKDQLSSYLHRVEAGERILVLRDGQVVAALVPYTDIPVEAEAAILERLAAQGAVVMPEGALDLDGPSLDGGPSAAQMALEDRR